MFPTCKRSLKTWVSEGSRDGEINLNYTGGPNVTTKALTGEGRRQRRQRRRRDRNTGQRDCRMLRSCFEGGEGSKVKERGQLPEAGRGRETSASIASWRKAARQRDRGPSRPMAWTCDVRNCKTTHLCRCKRPDCYSGSCRKLMQVVSTTEAVRGKTGHIPQGRAYWGSAERHNDLETTEERRGICS